MGRFIPRGSGPNGSRGKAVWLVLLTCALFLIVPMRLFAQAGESLRIYYCSERSFYIPFTLHENDPRLEILLNVSTDGRTYHYSATARPPDRRFHFPAPADGWYYFIVQTRDASGALSPENLRGAPPSIKVCVDTQNPIIDSFTADTPSDNNPLPTIRWKITEPNLKEILADYRSTSGGDWVPLFLPVTAEGTHTWKPSWGGELEVRMMALDKAERRSEVRTLRLRVSNNVTRMPPPQDQAGSGKVMFVKSKTFHLDYKLDDQTVGPSRVASVDIWKLHPGQGWRKCQEKAGAIGPATVSVETAGRWGFRLIPRSGVGLAERDPQPGDAPDIWVEVDDKKPRVQVTNVTVTPEADGGYLTVNWKAGDEFLRALPITIYWAAPEKGGEWTPLVKDLPNSGYWRQKTEELNLGPRYQFVLKVVAIDEAGNIGENPWGETVKVDLKIPRIKSIDVKPDGAAGGQQAYGASGVQSFGGQPFESQPPPKAAPSPITARDQNFSDPMSRPQSKSDTSVTPPGGSK